MGAYQPYYFLQFCKHPTRQRRHALLANSEQRTLGRQLSVDGKRQPILASVTRLLFACSISRHAAITNTTAAIVTPTCGGAVSGAVRCPYHGGMSGRPAGCCDLVPVFTYPAVPLNGHNGRDHGRGVSKDDDHGRRVSKQR